MPRYASENQELKAKLPEEIQETIEWHEARGFTDCPEYQGAIAVWFRRHVCRMRPWPEGLERAFATMGTDVYLHMVGPSEFFITGTLAKWDVTERLSEIAVPTLFISGEYDAIRPAHVRDMHERLPGSKLINYEQSSHLPFEEEREQFMADYREFMAATESASHRV